MKKSVLAIIAIAILIASFTEISAQYGRGHGRYGKGYCYNNNGPLYDLNSETTISGTVDSYELLKGNGRRGGLLLKVKTANGLTDVHMGPTWYLDNINLDINKGDKIEVFGSKVNLNNDTFVIASKVTHSGKEYKLRDKYGFPKWAGNRRNNN